MTNALLPQNLKLKIIKNTLSLSLLSYALKEIKIMRILMATLITLPSLLLMFFPQASMTMLLF